jgi:hypothetical protein
MEPIIHMKIQSVPKNVYILDAHNSHIDRDRVKIFCSSVAIRMTLDDKCASLY